MCSVVYPIENKLYKFTGKHDLNKKCDLCSTLSRQPLLAFLFKQRLNETRSFDRIDHVMNYVLYTKLFSLTLLNQNEYIN
jgi:hypothetical protein